MEPVLQGLGEDQRQGTLLSFRGALHLILSTKKPQQQKQTKSPEKTPSQQQNSLLFSYCKWKRFAEPAPQDLSSVPRPWGAFFPDPGIALQLTSLRLWLQPSWLQRFLSLFLLFSLADSMVIFICRHLLRETKHRCTTCKGQCEAVSSACGWELGLPRVAQVSFLSMSSTPEQEADDGESHTLKKTMDSQPSKLWVTNRVTPLQLSPSSEAHTGSVILSPVASAQQGAEDGTVNLHIGDQSLQLASFFFGGLGTEPRAFMLDYDPRASIFETSVLLNCPNWA